MTLEIPPGLKVLQNINPVPKRGPDLPDTPLSQPMPNLDTLIQALAQHMGTEESPGKGITGAVGIDDLIVCELGHGVGLGVWVRGEEVAFARVGRGGGGGDEGGGGALGDDDESGAGSVGFGEVGDCGGDLGNGGVLGGREAGGGLVCWCGCGLGERTYGHALGLGVRRSLGFIPDQDINIMQQLIQLNLEELGDKRRAQVECDDLAPSGGGLGDLHGGFDAVGEEESTNVEEFGVVDVFLDLGLCEVRGGELFGGSEGSNEGSAGGVSPP